MFRIYEVLIVFVLIILALVLGGIVGPALVNSNSWLAMILVMVLMLVYGLLFAYSFKFMLWLRRRDVERFRRAAGLSDDAGN